MPNDDPTIPAGAPVLPPEEQPMNISNMTPRNLVYGFLLAAGGLIGGGGVSVAANPSAQVEDMQEDVKEMKSSVEAMKTSMALVASGITQRGKDIDDLEDEVKELRARVRDLELGDRDK